MMLRTPPKRSRLEAFGSPLELSPVADHQEPDRRLELCEPVDEDGELDYSSTRCSYKCRNMVKSELLETLDIRDKQVAELEALVQSLQNKLQTTEIENQRLSGRVKYLDQSVVAALAQEQAGRLQRTQENEQAEERYRKQLLRCNEIQTKLLEEIRLKTEAEASARAAEAEIVSLKNELKSQAESSSREIQRLEEEAQRLQSDTELPLLSVGRESDFYSEGTSTRTIRRSEISDDFERRLREADAEESRQLYPLISDLQEKLSKVTEEKLALERKLAFAESNVLLKSCSTRCQGNDIVIKNLQEELNYHSAEIAEAKKLKDDHAKLELLKEELNFEKSRANQAEAQLETRTDTEMRVTVLEAKLKEWELLTNIPGVSSPHDIPELIANMQREISMALSEKMQLNSNITNLHTQLEKANIERQESITAASAAREEIANALQKSSRLELQVSRMTEEIKSLRAVLASYDEEEALNLKLQKSGSTEVPPTPEKSKQKRIEELENCVQFLQHDLNARESELIDSIGVATEQRKKAETLAENLARTEAKVSYLERDASQLREEIALLEHKVGRGEFDPTTTKVLRLRTNLDMQVAAQAVAEASETREESELILEYRQKNKSLTEKVKVLEHEVSNLKKREMRYLQVFADKASTFRKACGLMFGFQIHMNETDDSVTVFKLNSIYCADKNFETIEFHHTPDATVGHIEMMENAYTRSPDIERQVTTFVRGFRSIPAFMANLTLENFNKVTIS